MHVVDLRAKYDSAIRIAVVGSSSLAELLARGAKSGSIALVEREELLTADLFGFDLLVYILHPGEALGEAAKAAVERAANLLVVVDARRHLVQEEIELTLDLLPEKMIGGVTVVLTDSDIAGRFIPRVLERFADEKIALAASFPIFRPLVAGEIVTKTALQNGGIATISLIPGADMPILTANQLKMVLELMAVYGEEPSLGRLKEVMAVIGGGFLFRTVARELLDLLPGPGWLIKGGVAVSGTLALGKAAQAYFELGKGDRFEPLASDREAVTTGGEARPLH